MTKSKSCPLGDMREWQQVRFAKILLELYAKEGSFEIEIEEEEMNSMSNIFFALGYRADRVLFRSRLLISRG